MPQLKSLRCRRCVDLQSISNTVIRLPTHCMVHAAWGGGTYRTYAIVCQHLLEMSVNAQVCQHLLEISVNARQQSERIGVNAECVNGASTLEPNPKPSACLYLLLYSSMQWPPRHATKHDAFLVFHTNIVTSVNIRYIHSMPV